MKSVFQSSSLGWKCDTGVSWKFSGKIIVDRLSKQYNLGEITFEYKPIIWYG